MPAGVAGDREEAAQRGLLQREHRALTEVVGHRGGATGVGEVVEHLRRRRRGVGEPHPVALGDHAAQRGLVGVEAEGRLVPALVEGGPVAVEGVGARRTDCEVRADLLVVEEAAHQEAAVVLDARAHEGAVEPGRVDLGDGGDDVGERVVVGGRPRRPTAC